MKALQFNLMTSSV